MFQISTHLADDKKYQSVFWNKVNFMTTRPEKRKLRVYSIFSLKMMIDLKIQSPRNGNRGGLLPESSRENPRRSIHRLHRSELSPTRSTRNSMGRRYAQILG